MQECYGNETILHPRKGTKTVKDYHFIYIEQLDKVICIKDETGKKQTNYIITIYRRNTGEVFFNCDCPANVYPCRHIEFVLDEFDLGKEVTPKEWIDKVKEEYAINWLKNQKQSFEQFIGGKNG